jgi:hypothetical protein
LKRAIRDRSTGISEVNLSGRAAVFELKSLLLCRFSCFQWEAVIKNNIPKALERLTALVTPLVN